MKSQRGRGKDKEREYLNKKVREYRTKKRTFLLNGAPSCRNQSLNTPHTKKSRPIMQKPISCTSLRPTRSRYCTDSQ